MPVSWWKYYLIKSKGKIMLTREILAANAQLSGLTEEQIKAIITLSENDENSVIAKKPVKYTGL